jgi:hypothetical protein
VHDIVFSKLATLSINNSSVVQLLRKRSKQFGMDATYNVSANYTECERELEKE